MKTLTKKHRQKMPDRRDLLFRAHLTNEELAEATRRREYELKSYNLATRVKYALTVKIYDVTTSEWETIRRREIEISHEEFIDRHQALERALGRPRFWMQRADEGRSFSLTFGDWK